MAVIYTTTINGSGVAATEFAAENMIITFADNAPDSLADFVYRVDQNPVTGEVLVGQQFQIGDEIRTITAVGDVAQKNLNDLGHVTLIFDGAAEPRLPGAIHVSEGELPALDPGTTVTITTID